jgi:predicted dehydrogenase
VEDYQRLLSDRELQAVVVATPSHLHAEVAVAALAAGKHVYCEAPMATKLEDARAIGMAARRAGAAQVFQVGLQGRCHPERQLAAGFFKAGTAGRAVMARAQWHKKSSWRYAAPTEERTRELNWRLDRRVSLGLPGEVGMHHLDTVSWFLGVKPLAVTGAGSVRLWREDGRDVHDTVQLMVEYPEGLSFVGTLTLANSFEFEEEVVYGSDAAVVFRGGRGWMFKEADAPLFGWEVHARTETFHQDTGLVLLANASKQKAATGNAEGVVPVKWTPLHHALEAFVRNVQDVENAKADYVAAYGADDSKGLVEHLASVPRRGPGYQEGFEAAVVAIHASESVLAGRRIEFRPGWFELG